MDTKILTVGWREWATLPELHTPLIKVKIDTGAKTSALHVFNLKIIESSEIKIAEFDIHPLQENSNIICKNQAVIVDQRLIKSSNGQQEERWIIESPIKLANHTWNIEISLTNRDIMNHRMLLGRSALKNFIIDPAKSYYQGKLSKKAALKYYESIYSDIKI